MPDTGHIGSGARRKRFERIIALTVAGLLVFNYPFRWRRYPRALAVTAAESTRVVPSPYPDISHAQLVAALSQLDSFVDVSEQDLLRIYELATQRPHPQADDPG